MTSMNLIFTVLMLGCGLYCLYQSIQLIRTGEVPSNSILLSKERSMKDCLDPQYFVDYIKTKFLVFSIVVCCCGTFSLINDLTGFLNTLTAGLSVGLQLLVTELAIFIIPFGAIIWFSVCLVRIQKQLW